MFYPKDVKIDPVENQAIPKMPPKANSAQRSFKIFTA